MDALLLELVDALRVNGLRTSTAEVADAMRALGVSGLEAREEVRQVLGLTLAKSAGEKQVFESVFARFFALSELVAAAGAAGAAEAGGGQPAAQPGTAEEHQDGGAAPDGAAEAGGRGGPAAAEGEASGEGGEARRRAAFAAAQRAARGVGLRELQLFTQRGPAISRMLRFLQQEAGWEGEPAAGSAEAAAWAEVRQAVHWMADAYIALYARPRMERLRMSSLRRTDFARLSPQDVERAQTLLRRLARRLNQPLRRQRTRSQGQLDLRRTLRTNAHFGGAMLHLHWLKRTRPPPQVFAICDVSGSMAAHARFLLLLLHALHLALPRLRSFAFSSSLQEIGGFFRQHPPLQAIEAALRLVGGGATNYAAAWEGFLAHCERALTPGSVILIQGDGRNNYGDPQLALLRRMRRKARAVFWLNPEPPQVWGTGDSEMPRFAACCQGVWPCANLQQLEAAVSSLFLSLAAT